MRNSTAQMIKDIDEKIAKLKKYKGRGLVPFSGFMVDVSFSGNSCIDVPRISVGSASDDDGATQVFFDLIMNSLKNSKKFYQKFASDEIKELESVTEKISLSGHKFEDYKVGREFEYDNGVEIEGFTMKKFRISHVNAEQQIIQANPTGRFEGHHFNFRFENTRLLL